MQGDPNIVLVPDPTTFHDLALGTAHRLGAVRHVLSLGRPGAVLAPARCTATPWPKATRGGLRLPRRTRSGVVPDQDRRPTSGMDDLGGPGASGAGAGREASSHGFQYLFEDHNDEIDHVLHPLFQNLKALGLPIRSMENEWGPGQVEFTFEPLVGMAAADAMILMRAATRQVCRRLGYHATFMCKPAFDSFYSSGWHLHQSLADSGNGRQPVSVCRDPMRHCRRSARTSSAGLLAARPGGVGVHAPRRSTATGGSSPIRWPPIQASWAVDNRGAMIRVQGRPGDPGAHIENRVGEPAANPYLYMASQLVAGIDGIATRAATRGRCSTSRTSSTRCAAADLAGRGARRPRRQQPSTARRSAIPSSTSSSR